MERSARIVTLPNVITVARLAGAGGFVWLLADDHFIAAVVLLAVLGASDWVDGWIARRFDQGSDLGKVLDPVADRVLLITGAIALLAVGTVPVVVGVLVLAREAAVSAAVLSLAALGARRIDVRWVGKAGTLALMFALPLFLLADHIDDGRGFTRFAAWVFTIAGLGFSYLAALVYMPVARAALRDGRAARAAPQSTAPESMA